MYNQRRTNFDSAVIIVKKKGAHHASLVLFREGERRRRKRACMHRYPVDESNENKDKTLTNKKPLRFASSPCCSCSCSSSSSGSYHAAERRLEASERRTTTLTNNSNSDSNSNQCRPLIASLDIRSLVPRSDQLACPSLRSSLDIGGCSEQLCAARRSADSSLINDPFCTRPK